MTIRIHLLSLLALAACADDDDGGEQWAPLISGDWTVPSGEEAFSCVRKTLEHDLYVGAFSALIPPGTHHTVLSLTDATEPDGVGPCPGNANVLAGGTLVAGTASGTDPLVFPDGVAVRLDAGRQLLLSIHAFNVTAEPLSGTSGTLVRTVEADEVDDLADSTLMGPIVISLPPHRESTVVGGCRIATDATVIGVGPHMHQLGKHMRVVAEHLDGSETVLHDGAFDFYEQVNGPIAPTPIEAGAQIRVECTWNNTRDDEVVFGSSSLDEMCFAAIQRYPAADQITCFDYVARAPEPRSPTGG